MPILDPNTLEIFSHSSDQTRRVGLRLGALLKPGDIVCLSGDLGSGKTTLVQGIGRGWGSIDPISSPTFILVNEYRRADGITLSHLDAYRMAAASEAEDLDVGLMLERGPLVVEWPEKIDKVLPPERMWVDLRWLADEQRGLRFKGSGDRYQDMLVELRRRIFGGV
jgi:tRNA threonylcarbamoyladenosine biosynthesis protein TsaE